MAEGMIREAWAGGDKTIRALVPARPGKVPAVFLADAEGPAPEVLERCPAAAYIWPEPLDWNRELSPWVARGVRNDQPFYGEGAKTLALLRDHVIPEAKRRFSLTGPLYLAGYSLAGLWALWALHEDPELSGAASCSGSLWYPGITEYFRAHPLSGPKRIYLSLGRREKASKDPRLGTVAARTQEALAIFEAQEGVSAAFEWNEGGHFSDPGLRMAQGIRWLLEERR